MKSKTKKGLHQKWNTFSPKSSGDLRSDAHQSEIIEGDADEDHTHIIGGIQSNYWEGYIPPSPWVSAPLPALVSPFIILIGNFALRNFVASEKDNLFFQKFANSSFFDITKF